MRTLSRYWRHCRVWGMHASGAPSSQTVIWSSTGLIYMVGTLGSSLNGAFGWPCPALQGLVLVFLAWPTASLCPSP